MTTMRSYRTAMPEEEAERELRRCAGGQFDPVVVDGLLAVLAAVRAARPAAELRAPAPDLFEPRSAEAA